MYVFFKFFINIHEFFSIGRSWLEFLGIKFRRSGLFTLETIQLPGTNSIEHLFEFSPFRNEGGIISHAGFSILTSSFE